MYVRRMEIVGFKTFAQKTVLEFPRPKKGQNPLTVIVGPNGSGKSNIADAIRWCLGEQSLKTLRGKNTEDVIFSGGQGRGRSGFAEVAMVFDNADKVMGEMAEVELRRRVYRDGTSEYLLNGEATRLSDIQLLLAEAGVGQRSYAVIGQGLIDQILLSSPEDRKTFFDDATGVRGLQMRRQQALAKLARSAENLAEVRRVLAELEPRLNLLARQAKKLAEREAIEAGFVIAAKNYYGSLLSQLQQDRAAVQGKTAELEARAKEKKTAVQKLDDELTQIELARVATNAEKDKERQVRAEAYKSAQQELAAARRAEFVAERDIELARVRAQSQWAPLPLSSIIDELTELAEHHGSVVSKIKAATTIEEVQAIVEHIEGLSTKVHGLRTRLVRPAPEQFSAPQELLAAVTSSKERVVHAEATVKMAEAAFSAVDEKGTEEAMSVVDVQRRMRLAQDEYFAAEQARNNQAVDIARLEERERALKSEMAEMLPLAIAQDLDKGVAVPEGVNVAQAHEEMRRLRRQMEMIGSIDPEVAEEHRTVAERYTFLSAQVDDLTAAIESSEKLIDDLDKDISLQAEESFAAIEREFKKYFKMLFGGGDCALLRLKSTDEVADEAAPAEAVIDPVLARVQARREAFIGVDIEATPPGKKVKALSLLSGGERALTSIALLCAVMSTNPSPFLVLDEVDAALDETNTTRFANIINELREKTQFIVITHNRATMEKADALYGVTISDEGVSKLLSVRFEDIDHAGGARR